MENFRPMKINIQDLPKAITAWADEVLIPKSSLIQKGLITFVLLQGQSRFQELLDPLNLLADKDFSSVRAFVRWDDIHAGNVLSSLIRIAYSQSVFT